MHRNRTWSFALPEERIRNRTLPIEGGDGSTLSLDFTTGVLDPRLTFNRDGGGTYVANDGYIYGMDFATSSSLAIGTGSKSVTLTATAGVDRRYLVGQTVWISNGANNMRGPVTAYNASTQVLTINATATSGSGSFTSWSVGNASPRFDHDPTSIGTPRGLLIEGSAVNLALRSNDFNTTLTDGTQWVVGIYTRGDVSTTLPDGTTGNACRISGTGSASFRSQSIAVNASTAYTFSFWARNNGGSQARYRVWNATAGSSIVDHTLPGSNYVSQIGGANNTSTTWVRVSVTFTTPVGCTSIFVYPTSSDTGTVDLLLWGAQVELGSGASSYIPTGASQGSRAADHCTMPTSSFITGPLYPQTLFVECIPATPSAASPDIVRLFDRTAGGTFNYGNEIYYFGSATMSVQRKINSSSGTDRALASGLSYNTRHKFATAIDSSSFLGSYDGLTGSGATTAAAALASQVTHLGVGCNGDASPLSVMFGTVRQIKFFPFAMAQAQLNALTTL